MPADVEITRPAWLLALPVLAVLLALARLPWWRAALAQRATSPRPLRAEARRLLLRLAWLSLPVLALAGLALSRSMERLAVVFVVDSSTSTAAVRDQQAEAVSTALKLLGDGDIAGVVAVSDGPGIEQALSENPVFGSLGAPSVAASNLASGLTLAGGLIPSDRSGRVVLVSDGRETAGDAAAAARDLIARGISVDVLPVGPQAVVDLRLDRINLPETARERESSVLRASVTSGRSTSAQLRIYRDDALLLEQPVSLRAGRQELALALPPADAGTHRIRVEVSGDDSSADGTPLNNVLGAVQRVLGSPRVLIVAATPGAAGLLPGALEAGGAIVQVATPSALPVDLAGMAAYDAIVLADVSAFSMPPGSMELLERYVRELGRGLVMTGGPDAFGPGGYAGTPVEDALPVYMDLQGRGREPRVAMVLVIDKSGSMQGIKMEMAKEAAVRSVRLLKPQDRVAVLAFDSVPQWVTNLAEVGDAAAIESAVGAVFAGGGTEIYPAVSAAFEALRQAEADVKHLIVLTDGHSGSGGDYVALLERLREERTTLSSVAVGSDADRALLEALASGGRGRAHVAQDPEQLPEIFTEETVMATRSILVDGPFFAAAALASPLLRGLDAAPALDGYVAVTPKERAETVLLAPEGDPILAAWQYGAGRAIAWTPDLGGRWSRRWAAGDAATTLWGNALSWLLPPPDEGELLVRVEPEAGGFALLAENRTAWDEVRPTSVTLVGSAQGNLDLDLSPAGPGRYRTALPRVDAGAYVIQAKQTLASGDELRAETGWAAPYPAEYREFGIDQATLTRIAEAGNGLVLQDSVDAMRRPDQARSSRWSFAALLIVLAAITWPLEVASRRLPAPAAPRWLRERLATRATATEEASPAPGSPGAPIPGPIASQPATTTRLLERTRSLRQQRKR